MATILDFNAEKNKRKPKKQVKKTQSDFIKNSVEAIVDSIDARRTLMVVPCLDTRNNQIIQVLCTPVELSKGEFIVLPLAQIFEQNPLDFLKPIPEIVSGET